jgi:translation initiation factor 1
MSSRKKLTGGKGWVLVRSCPRCGRSEEDCRCAGAPPAPGAGPATARLRVEKRAGKSITVIQVSGWSAEAVQDLLKELKSALAAGGTMKGGEAELQGEHRERLRALLSQKGLVVKG